MEDFKKILVPFDDSEHAKKALERAVYLAKLCGADLILLHVVDLNKKISSFEQVSTGGYVPGELKEEGYKMLLRAAVRLPKEIKAEYIVEIGRPSENVIETCLKENCDLIVMGSRGLSTLKQLLLGSVSGYVACNSICPVMIVH